jgi:glycerol kinase
MLQFLSDMIDREVQRPKLIETTVLGAAYLAGLGSGMYASLESIEQFWQQERRFTPQIKNAHRQQLYSEWQNAVARVQTRSQS